VAKADVNRERVNAAIAVALAQADGRLRHAFEGPDDAVRDEDGYLVQIAADPEERAVDVLGRVDLANRSVRVVCRLDVNVLNLNQLMYVPDEEAPDASEFDSRISYRDYLQLCMDYPGRTWKADRASRDHRSFRSVLAVTA
jgi:hypothetical protein